MFRRNSMKQCLTRSTKSILIESMHSDRISLSQNRAQVISLNESVESENIQHVLAVL